MLVVLLVQPFNVSGDPDFVSCRVQHPVGIASMISGIAKKNADKATILEFTFDRGRIGLGNDADFAKNPEVILIFGRLTIEAFVRRLGVRVVDQDVVQLDGSCGGFGP